MKRCAIIDDYQRCTLEMADWSGLEGGVQVEVFDTRINGENEVARYLGDFEIICIMRERTPFLRTQFEKLPKLQLLLTSGMRNLSIDVAAASEHDVVVCGTPALGYPTAELTWGLILASVRSIPGEDRATRAGGWQQSLGIGLQGKTLGVIGLGRRGRQVARIGMAFGMEVIAWSTNLTEERCADVGIKLSSKVEIMAEADVITIHQLLSERTRGLIGATELALMKPDARLINTSRGPIVDEAALIDVLKRGAIAGAALDVFDVEPLPLDHPFRRLQNTVITPHLGYVTVENYRAFYSGAVENIRAWLAGAPIRVVEP